MDGSYVLITHRAAVLLQKTISKVTFNGVKIKLTMLALFFLERQVQVTEVA